MAKTRRPGTAGSGNRSGASRNRPARSGNPAHRNQPVTRRRPDPAPVRRVPMADAAVEADSVLPPDGAEYPQVLRGAGYSWKWSLLGVLFGVSLFFLMTQVISQLVVSAAWSIAGDGVAYAEFRRGALAFERPSGMLGANLGIAFLIPISFVLLAIIHRVRPRWLMSVQPRLRWRYLLLCVGVALVALNGVLALSTLVSTTPVFGAQQGFWGFLVVIVLTSPLQAAAEEVFFRGYLMQALGSLVAQPWFGVVTSALIFALFHGTQNLPLFVDRLAFGLLAGVLVWRTGGLEAGIAAHVVNNICAYVLAGLTTSIASVRAIQQIGWLDTVFDVGGFALFAVLALLLARKMQLRIRVDLALAR